MHELLYYSIFAIILYFVLTQVFENFNIEQENFDPSLVPVSSIVTLAKVAQKLVNGNGTLTNPGNLQIGASASTPGNLTVTGGINVTGSNGTISVTEVDGHPINNALSVGKVTVGTFAPDPSHDIIRSGGSNGLLLSNASKKIFVWGKNDLYCQNNLSVTGNTTHTGSTTTNGALMVNNNLFIGNKAMLYSNGDKFANDNYMRLMKADGSAAYFGMNGGGLAVSNLYSEQDTTANRNLQVNGSILNGGLTIKGGSASPDSTLLQFGDGTGWRARIGKAGSPTLDVYDNAGGGVQVTGNLSATGVLQLNGSTNSSNGQINDKDGVSRLLFFNNDKNTYYDAGAGNIHYFRGHRGAEGTNVNIRGNLVVANGSTINGDLNITGKLQFNGRPAMYYRDYSGLGSYNNINTGIDGNYQAAFGKINTTGLWEYYKTDLTFNGTWHFTVFNMRYGDNPAYVVSVRIYFFHNNLF